MSINITARQIRRSIYTGYASMTFAKGIKIIAVLLTAVFIVSCSYSVSDVVGESAYVTGELTTDAGIFAVAATLDEWHDVTSVRTGSLDYYDENGNLIFTVTLTKTSVTLFSGGISVPVSENAAETYRTVMRLFSVCADSILTREVSGGTAYTSYGGEPTVYCEANAETGIPSRLYCDGADFCVSEWSFSGG